MKTHITFENSTILITGSVGFIGSNLVMRLLDMKESFTVVGIDNFSDYYDPNLKQFRLEEINVRALKSTSHWIFRKLDISNRKELVSLFEEFHPDLVINLAAQAGVRYSITNPDVYIQTNINGFFNILECCRYNAKIKHLVFASSSSVYGGNTKIPFSESDIVDSPVSLYAATKKSNELLAYSYAKLYNIPITGLRFFTVYGPAGRPDMAYYSFANKLVNDEKIDIFNYGNCKRDFTYIDDIIEGIVRVLHGAPTKYTNANDVQIVPYEIYNIGNSKPENLLDFVNILFEEMVLSGILENNFDIDSHLNLKPMQPGDVPITYADTTKLYNDYGFKPYTDLRSGLRNFSNWYKNYYHL